MNRDELPLMDELNDEDFLRLVSYSSQYHMTFRDNPEMKRVVARLAGITLQLHRQHKG